MVTYLLALTSLEHLFLEFKLSSPSSNRESQHSPPPTRAVLPTLTHLSFTGFSEYLEDLLARIDAPRVNRFSLMFSDELAFDTPQVIQFISRTPKLSTPEEAQALFDFGDVVLTIPSPPSTVLDIEGPTLGTSCIFSYEQLYTLAEAGSSSLFPLSTVKQLYVKESDDQSICYGAGIDSGVFRWLFRPFTSVKTLYLTDYLAQYAMPAIRKPKREKVLPVLENIVSYWL